MSCIHANVTLPSLNWVQRIKAPHLGTPRPLDAETVSFDGGEGGEIDAGGCMLPPRSFCLLKLHLVNSPRLFDSLPSRSYSMETGRLSSLYFPSLHSQFTDPPAVPACIVPRRGIGTKSDPSYSGMAATLSGADA